MMLSERAPSERCRWARVGTPRARTLCIAMGLDEQPPDGVPSAHADLGEARASSAMALVDEVVRLRRAKEAAEAEAASARADVERAWREMQEAWEVREEEEERLRQLMARLEARNTDLELRDRELRGSLARLADTEKALTHARLLQKLVYKAFHKGFLNDEEEDEVAGQKRDGAARGSGGPQGASSGGGRLPATRGALARQHELNQIAAFIQCQKQRRAGSDSPAAIAGIPSTTASTTSTMSTSASVFSGESVSVDASSSSSSSSSVASSASSCELVDFSPMPSDKVDEVAVVCPPGREDDAGYRDPWQPTENPMKTSDSGRQTSAEGNRVGEVKGRAGKPTKAVIQPPPLARTMQRSGMRTENDKNKTGISLGGSTRGTTLHLSGPEASQACPQNSGQPSRNPNQSPAKRPPTTLQDLFAACPPAEGSLSATSSRGHSRSRSVGQGTAATGAVPSDQSVPTSAGSLLPTSKTTHPVHRLGATPSEPPPPPPPPSSTFENKRSKVERKIYEYCGQGLNEEEDEEEKVPVAVHRLVLHLRGENFFAPTSNRAFIKTCNNFLVSILKAISSCVKMSKRDIKAQAFWLSYTTSFIRLLKRETKGKLEGMRQIQNPQRHAIQLLSVNKLIKKITSLPDTSTECMVLSRRVEICGFACKLLQITQRIYSNLLHILTKQLDPLLIPVVFYHDRSAPAPFVVAQNLQQSKPSSGHVRESLRPGHTSSSSSVPSSRISNLPSVSRNTSPPHLLTSLAIAKPAHADFSCTKNGNDILLVLSRMFHHLMSHNVYCAVVQQFFTQAYHVMDAILFNHLIDNARSLATVSSALAVKSMLSQLISWRRRANLQHRKSKQLVHVREALNVLSMSKAMFLEIDTTQAFFHLNDLQILHLLVHFKPDELAPEPVPSKVKQRLQERSQQQAKNLSLRIDPALMFVYKGKKDKCRQSL